MSARKKRSKKLTISHGAKVEGQQLNLENNRLRTDSGKLYFSCEIQRGVLAAKVMQQLEIHWTNSRRSTGKPIKYSGIYIQLLQKVPNLQAAEDMERTPDKNIASKFPALVFFPIY